MSVRYKERSGRWPGGSEWGVGGRPEPRCQREEIGASRNLGDSGCNGGMVLRGYPGSANFPWSRLLILQSLQGQDARGPALFHPRWSQVWSRVQLPASPTGECLLPPGPQLRVATTGHPSPRTWVRVRQMPGKARPPGWAEAVTSRVSQAGPGQPRYSSGRTSRGEGRTQGSGL